MIPNDIQPDPDFPNAYAPFGKPESMNDEDCGTLTVLRVGATGDILHEPAARIVSSNPPSGDSVYPCFMSQWSPTQEERERLHNLLDSGEPIDFRMLIVGNGLPPVSLWLRDRFEA